VHFEKRLIPKIRKVSLIRNWSDRGRSQWMENSLEGKLLAAHSRDKRESLPLAFVFYPNGRTRLFDFCTALKGKALQGNSDYRIMEKEFLAEIRDLSKK